MKTMKSLTLRTYGCLARALPAGLLPVLALRGGAARGLGGPPSADVPSVTGIPCVVPD